MRTSPLLLAFFVLLGLFAVGLPVWRLTTSMPGYASESETRETAARLSGSREIDLVIWVSHLPTDVTLRGEGGEPTTVRIGEDGLQEVYATIGVPLDAEEVKLVVTAEHVSDDAVESVITLTANRGNEESRELFFKFAGFGEEEMIFDWQEHHHHKENP